MPSWKKVITSGSAAALNSLTVSNGITGSLYGTSSWAVSSSYASTSSYSLNPTISGSISLVDYINFNTASAYTLAEGKLGWDSGEGGLQLGMAGGNVQYALGEQLMQYCYNTEGTTLSKGQVVLISGSQGNKIAVKLADNSADSLSAGTLGFVAETITAGGNGWVITEGNLKKLNTIGLAPGALLYLGSTPGSYTQTIPQAPLHTVRLGYVERVHATVGAIYIKIDNGYELGELHDVIDSTTTSSYGDLLIKSGSVWINSKQLTGSYGLTGSLQATSFTGSFSGSHFGPLTGTASYASQALSASFSSTSSFLNSTTNAFIQNGNSFGTTALLGTNDNQSLAIETNGSEKMRITAAGDVGIGTSLPSASLHVKGAYTAATSASFLVQNSNASSSMAVFGDNKLKVYSPANGTSTVNLWSDNTTAYLGTSGIGAHISMAISTNTTTFSQAGFFQNGVSIVGSPWYGYVLNLDKGIYIADDYLRFGTGRIDSSGSLGLGKTVPTAKLDISGSALITGSLTVTNGITGSLFGTSSWAVSASWAPATTTAATASFVTSSNVFGPNGSNSILSASFAISSSNAATASWATNVTNNGVTSVSASGTVSGITLGGGPITSTGTLTLSGTVSGLTNSNLSGTAGITNANLATPSLMVGTTNIALGATGSTLAGLTTVTATAFTGSFSGSHFGPLTGTASYATQALSASFAPDTTFPYTGSALITGSLGITGSLDLIYNTASSNGISVTGHFPRLILVNSGSGATGAGGIISVRDNNFITKTGGAVVFSINATDAGSSSVGRIVFTKASNSSTNVSIWNSGTEGAFYISGSGNIGIGTTTPGSKLDVAGALGGTIGVGGSTLRLINTDTSNAASITAGITGVQNEGMQFSTDGTVRMVISSGKIGINTTAPTHRFTSNVSSMSPSGDQDYPIFASVAGKGVVLGYDSSNDISVINGVHTAVAWKGIALATVGGNVGIGTYTPAYKLDVNGDTNITGTLTATVKSFIIDHPTKEGKKLQYGVLEGPEHSVYVRGKLTNNNTIQLPDHWTGLVHEDTITVNLTPIGKRQDLWVETVTDTAITVGSDNEINCFYTVFAERKDIEKLVTEFDK